MTTLTVREVADVAEVSPRTVREHIRQGRLRAVKRGRDWQIAEADAGAWLTSYTPYDTLRKGAGS